MLRAMWKVLARPSGSAIPDPQWYRWATNQCGHVLLGAFLSTWIPWDFSPWIIATIVMAFYAVAKEVPDCWLRGGKPRDCLFDTLFVGLGALYEGPWGWPWVAMAAVGIGAIARARNG